jgi:hypothetical protein
LRRSDGIGDSCWHGGYTRCRFEQELCLPPWRARPCRSARHCAELPADDAARLSEPVSEVTNRVCQLQKCKDADADKTRIRAENRAMMGLRLRGTWVALS